MRTGKTLSISMSPTQLQRVERLARRENRTLSELVCEALCHYEQKSQSQFAINSDLIAALRAVQENAAKTALLTMTEAGIDAEVQAVRRRREKRIELASR